MSTPRMGRCPQCGAAAALEAENRFRPFCSERCKLLDFGAWIGGRYGIPVAHEEFDPDAPEADEDPPSRLQ